MSGLAIFVLAFVATSAGESSIKVGSKSFTESVILGEMACDVLRRGL